MHTRVIVRAALSATLVASAAVAAPSLAATVGNPTINRGIVDSSAGLTFVLDQGFGATPGLLTSFSFFAGRGGDVTPLLFSRVDTAGAISFTLQGIGTTRNVGTGLYTFDFGLTQGSALTNATSYFGFRTVNLGVGSYSYQASTLPGAFAKGVTNGGIGSVLSFDPASRSSDTGDGLNFRAYSINATTSPVPEPATWGMMLLGFSGLAYSLRRRARVGARIRFA